MIDIRIHNREAWNQEVERGNKWTVPVDHKTIVAAREGEWGVYLTPTTTVPRDWFPPLMGADVLCLASGGGQQGPIFAAAGAQVTVFDNSPRQLAQDRMVAEREDLELATIEGDMADLSIFPDQSFDLIFHPVSNVFVPHLQPIWDEAYRVLRPSGVLLAGFTNPMIYLFDYEVLDHDGVFKVKYSLPYSDLEHLPPDELERRIEKNEPLEFSHSFDEQIGGQLKAGFVITGFYEDEFDDDYILNDYLKSFMATRAVKLSLRQ